MVIALSGVSAQQVKNFRKAKIPAGCEAFERDYCGVGESLEETHIWLEEEDTVSAAGGGFGQPFFLLEVLH